MNNRIPDELARQTADVTMRLERERQARLNSKLLLIVMVGLCAVIGGLILFSYATTPALTLPVLRDKLNGMCQQGETAVLYVGDTTVIAGRFVECGRDYVVMEGLEAPSKTVQRWVVTQASIKLVREVPE